MYKRLVTDFGNHSSVRGQMVTHACGEDDGGSGRPDGKFDCLSQKSYNIRIKLGQCAYLAEAGLQQTAEGKDMASVIFEKKNHQNIFVRILKKIISHHIPYSKHNNNYLDKRFYHRF